MKEIGNTRKNRGLLLLLAVCLLLSACGKGASSPAAAAETSAGMAREDMIYNEESGMAPGSTDYKSETAEPSGMTSSSGGIQPVNTKRKLIRTVSMNLETMEFDELMESINKKVAKEAGKAPGLRPVSRPTICLPL